MASLFKQRKPKRIVSSASDDPEDEDTGPAVRRPGTAKAKSKLRVAFDPSQDHDSSNLPSENEAPLIKPAKSRPSTALQDKLRETSLRERERSDESRPTYSKSYLDELRNSTPSTPLSLTTTTPPTEQQLDITSKFPHTISNGPSHIPTSTEIAAFKARRLRAAHESTAANDDNFIPLDDDQLYDSDGEFKPSRLQVGTYIPPSTHSKDTRLVPDDEDIMEGFDAFTSDTNPTSNRLTMDLSRRAERQRLKATKEAMRQRIAAAEGTNTDDPDTDDTDAEEYDSDDVQLHAAYEQAQFHAGLDGLGPVHDSHTRQTRRPKQPKIITPVERVSVRLDTLREQTVRIGLERAKLERRKGEIEKERKELEAQRMHVQSSLVEASVELERVLGSSSSVSVSVGVGVGGAEVVRSNVERGLDSLGTRVEGTTIGGGGGGEDGGGVSQ